MKSVKKITKTQLELGTGYADFHHNGSTSQTITTTPSILTIDGANSNTFTSQTPVDATEPLWDNDRINMISLYDSGLIRLNLEISATTGSATLITYVLDIGGQSTITIPVAQDTIQLDKTTPFIKTKNIPIYAKETFLANGGQIFLYTDANTATILGRSIFIKIDYRGRII